MKIRINIEKEIERIPIWFCSNQCEFFRYANTDENKALCFLFNTKGEKLDYIHFPDGINKFQSLYECSILKRNNINYNET